MAGTPTGPAASAAGLPSTGQHERHQGEESEQNHLKERLRRRACHEIFIGGKARHRLLVVDRPHGGLDFIGQRHGVQRRADHERPPKRQLRDRYVELHPPLHTQSEIVYSPNDADDLGIVRLAQVDQQSLANGVFVGKYPGGKRLIDDHHVWAIKAICIGELPSPNQRDAHHLEEVRAHRTRLCIELRIGAELMSTGNGQIRVVCGSGEREMRRDGHVHDAGHSPDALGSDLHESGLLFPRVVTRRWKRDSERQSVVDVESRIDVVQSPKTLDEKAGPDQQYHR